jgi:hypothetical protein
MPRQFAQAGLDAAVGMVAEPVNASSSLNECSATTFA